MDHVNPTTVIKDIDDIKHHIDRAWDRIDDLLLHLYGEDGAGKWEALYDLIVEAYEEYLVKASRLIDRSAFEAAKISKG